MFSIGIHVKQTRCSAHDTIRASLLSSFDVESFVFQFAIQKYEDEDIQNYNVSYCFTWV
jgi:hypothetical protein